MPNLYRIGQFERSVAPGCLVKIKNNPQGLAELFLGARLIECTQLVNAVEGRTVDQIFGYPDNLKFHSSMTLFASVSEEGSAFHKALAKYFGQRLDQLTMQLLK